mmetsp:Transcript_33396/g.58545  ORF Transcript_33396/g.58545 Transcript_33396/m.58545 type:complete len:737 (+) Transcript_33396:58-2268(+)
MRGNSSRRCNRLSLVLFVCIGFYMLTGPVYLYVKSNWHSFLYVKNILTAKKYTGTYPTSTAFSYSTDFSLAEAQSCPDCSFKLTNAEYLEATPQEPTFLYEDSDSLAKLNATLACLPKNFGYSREEGDKIFPHKEYPTCASQVKDPYPMIHIDLETNRLSMNCSSRADGKFLLGPTDNRKFTMRREVEDLWQIKKYPGKPIEIEPWHEFALGTCSDSEFFDQATYMLRPNYTASLIAKNHTRHWQKETGVSRRPLIVFLLVVDSYSRRHFFRKMPETVEYLNGLNKQSKYRVFDYKLHNIIGGNSVANQVPLLTKSVRDSNFEPNQDLGEEALWNIYRDKGFVSYFGFEDCDDSFPRKLGRLPHIDHAANPFYCATYKFTDCRQSKSSQKQRCIGPHMSHHYIMNHTWQFSEAYPENNQWLYLHLSAAHEATGQHAQALDHDLKGFIENYLQTFGKTHEVLIMLEADHGMRYGDWFNSVEAFQENRLPVFFIIAPYSVLNNIEYSLDTLKHNSLRLNSKLDIRKTLIYFSGYPYGLNITSTEEYDASNLFTEKISDSRTCADIGINPWHCSCMELEDIDLSVATEAQLALLNHLAELAVSKMNSEVYGFEGASKGKVCQKLSLNRIEAAYGTGLNSVKELVKIEISVAQSSSFRIEVSFKISSDNSAKDKNATQEVYVYEGLQKYIRILSFLRLDRYVGACEILAREASLNAEYCVCREDVQDERLLAKIAEKYKT